MRTKILFQTLILSFGLMINGYSQNEYFSNNVSWGVAKGISEPFYLNYNLVGYVVGGDSVINNIIYKVLYEDGISIIDDQVEPGDPPGSVGYYSESAYHNANPIGFYRSEEKRIYRYNTISMSEVLLYDFDVAVGDTMDVSEEMFYGNVVVYDIDSMQIGGEWRKVIYASLDSEPLLTDLFVEGIGNLISGLDGLPIANVSDVLYYVSCYSYNGEHYQPDLVSGNVVVPIDLPCEYAVGIVEQSKPVSFDIYPNPTFDQVRISNLITHMGDELTISDITGKIIHQEKVSKSMISFDASQMPEGLYFLQIDGEVGKVMVER